MLRTSTKSSSFDELDFPGFVAQWLAEQPHQPPREAYEKAGPHTGVTLYRSGNRQVQLWICPPDSTIGEHAHPHAEGYAVKVAGVIVFKVNGRIAPPIWASLGGMPTRMVHVPAGAMRSAVIGHGGASFLAITKWRERIPESVHLDWIGEPLDEHHAAKLEKV